MIFSTEERKSIKAGSKKAKRDIAKIEEHRLEHESRHAANPNYNCYQWSKDFWQHLGEDIGDNFERAGYLHVADRYQRKHPEMGGSTKLDAKALAEALQSAVPIEMDGTETRADVAKKLLRAAREQKLFDDVVSETDFEGEEGLENEIKQTLDELGKSLRESRESAEGDPKEDK